MQNFQKLVWILSIVPLFSHQNEMDNIGIYNALENHSYVGIWTLQNEIAEIDIYQVQGIINFFNNSIIYKGFSPDDQQVEQFSGEISLNNVQLTSIEWRGIGQTLIKGENSLIQQQCENEFIVIIEVNNNTKTMNDAKIIIILNSSNHEQPHCNFQLKFSSQKQSSSENSLQQILIQSLAFIFCISQLALPLIFLKFVLHKTIKLYQFSLIGLFFKYRELLFILFLDPYCGLILNFYIELVAIIMYILLLSVWTVILFIAFLEKNKNHKFFRRCPCLKFLIIICVYHATIVGNLILFDYCKNSLLFQLTYALILFPQIIHNIRWNCKENFNLFYLFGYLSSGLLFIAYLKFYQAQINDKGQDYLFFSLFYGIYFISLFLIFLQHKFGSSCLVPKWILDKYYQICAICLDSIVELDMENQLQLLPIILTKCKHKFHEKCLRQWLQQKNDCPLCRTNLNEMNF